MASSRFCHNMDDGASPGGQWRHFRSTKQRAPHTANDKKKSCGTHETGDKTGAFGTNAMVLKSEGESGHGGSLANPPCSHLFMIQPALSIEDRHWLQISALTSALRETKEYYEIGRSKIGTDVSVAMGPWMLEKHRENRNTDIDRWRCE